MRFSHDFHRCAPVVVATLPLTAGAAGMDHTEPGADARLMMAANLSLQEARDLVRVRSRRR